MSVEKTTQMFVCVPVKLLAAQVLRAIKQDQDIIELELRDGAHGKITVYADGEHVFTEPGE